MSDIHVLMAMLNEWVDEAVNERDQADTIRATLAVNINRHLIPKEINDPDTLVLKVVKALELLHDTTNRLTLAKGLLKTALVWGLDGDRNPPNFASRKQIQEDILAFFDKKGTGL